ncbi:Kelch-like protein 12 [Dissostichus eleginoides]|uniref:Kelch-like protein 12 n=1 Tax=Dissostichus eleginoides TaxID=100907 RepID=A0AAD9FDZ6_DISEL|nr:Kelch-like protein 12 [Dissostichus eleginoides]
MCSCSSYSHCLPAVETVLRSFNGSWSSLRSGGASGGNMAPKDIMTNSHAKSILNAMNALRKSNTLCDITLRVNTADFPAHRIVLAACSDYFCAMFTSEGLTASTMEILLDFVYTETVLVTVENVQELLPAACLLQLKGVKRACCDFLEGQLDPTNCLGIRDFAETHNCLDLMQAAELFSQKHFSEVVQHEEFMLLCQAEVEKLIKCDEIQVRKHERKHEIQVRKHEKTRDTGEETREKTRDTGEETREKTRDTGEETREKTRDTGEETREKTRDTGEETREKTRDTGEETREKTRDTGEETREKTRDTGEETREKTRDT